MLLTWCPLSDYRDYGSLKTAVSSPGGSCSPTSGPQWWNIAWSLFRLTQNIYFFSAPVCSLCRKSSFLLLTWPYCALCITPHYHYQNFLIHPRPSGRSFISFYIEEVHFVSRFSLSSICCLLSNKGFNMLLDDTWGGTVLRLAVICNKALQLKCGFLVHSTSWLPSLMLLTVELAGLLDFTLVDFTLQGVSRPSFLTDSVS